MNPLRIAIVGSGGVGGYFGGRLAAAGAHVTFIARGAHLSALRTHGLHLESPKGDLHLPSINATDDPATIGPVDVVLFAVKIYDAESAAQMLPPLMGADTVVVPLQNGVDAAATVTGAVGAAHAAGGVAYVSAFISEPSVIRHIAMDRLLFGELDGRKSTRLERLLEACQTAGFQATLSEHIDVEIWSKFVRLSVMSGMTSVTRSSIGILRDDPDLLAMTQAALLEAMAVARKKGIALPTGVFDDVMTMMQGLPAQTKSSMLDDLERGRRLELPWLSGAVVRLGHDVGVETPTHRFIATVLKPHVNGTNRVIE